VLRADAQMTAFSFWKVRGVFTWAGGVNTQVNSGIFGTQGTAAAGNFPSARYSGVNWADGSGSFWLYGGYGCDSTGAMGLNNDLWKYNPTSGQWTWVSGSRYGSSPGVYGVKGTGSTANFPGGRNRSSGWVDASGSFWLFGGEGYDASGDGNWYYMNDLWKYDPTNGQWTWMSGSSTGQPNGVYGTKGTGSTANFPGGRSTPVTWLDASGNAWLFGGYGRGNSGTSTGAMSDLWTYETSTGKWTWISGPKTPDSSGTYGTKGVGATVNTPSGRSNGASWMDGSGTLWLFGGGGKDSAGSYGDMNDLWKFVPATKFWTWVAGSNLVSAAGTYGTPGTGSTANIPGARHDAAVVKDGSGNFWLFGGYGYDANGSSNDLNDLWKLDASTLTWTWVSGSNLVDQGGTYGTLGAAAAGNRPGGRQGPFGWLDASGNMWFFGGNGKEGSAQQSLLSDLWKYTPGTGFWAWMSGPAVNTQIGIYGTQGTAAAANLPGARAETATWKDGAGNFWLFGGGGFDSVGITGGLNDLWKYDVVAQKWTWVAGSKLQNQNGSYGSLGTGSTANFPGGRVRPAAVTDASGILWLYGGFGMDSAGTFGALNDLWKFDPSSTQWKWVMGSNLADQNGTFGTKGIAAPTNLPWPRQPAGSWLDASGNFWIFGGTARDNTGGYSYANDLWKYDGTTQQWTWISGASALDQSGSCGAKGTGSIAYTPGGRARSVSWLDLSGNFWLFGGLGYDCAGNPGTMNDLWKFNPSNLQWTWVAGANGVGASGTYGTLRVGGATMTPGARQSAQAWVDGAGSLWLMGGEGNDGTGTSDLLNDLWKYTPSTNQWTWMAGSNLANQNGSYGVLGVPALSRVPGARSGQSVWVQNATVWIFGGMANDGVGGRGDLNDFWKFVP
jgi:N-acetylneuraminic acid mutarotase